MQIENLKDDSEVTISIFAVAALDGDPSVVVGKTVRGTSSRLIFFNRNITNLFHG